MEFSDVQRPPQNWLSVIGLSLVIGGTMVLIDQTFHLRWLEACSLIAVGLVLLIGGSRIKRVGLVMAGGLCIGLGLGISFAAILLPNWQFWPRIGIVIIGLSFGFALAGVLVYCINRLIKWWTAIPAGVLLGLGYCLAFSPARVADFALYIGVGLGSALLGIGIYKRLLGLIIAGCILVSVGLGIYMAWGRTTGVNAMASTGTMLVWFGLGWGLITVFSRTIIEKFIWWPLIPGGVLAVVGCGLYIGGNPGNALSFIGNTGSIAIIIFGVYLLLMRRGIRY